MKPYRMFSLLLAAVLTASCSFPAFAANESDIPADRDAVPESASISGNELEIPPVEVSAPEMTSVSENQSELLSEENAPSEPAYAAVSENQPEMTTADRKPGFSASLSHCSDGYVVKGCFTEFLPDTVLVQPQSSPDGENWQDCGVNWHLSSLGKEDPDSLYALQNQICLYSTFEPLKSYLAGKLDRFYLRLHIATESGMAYETEAAVIERGESMPVPEEITFSANFAPTMLFRETDSSGNFVYCGRYQLTVRAGASPEEVASYLPDTLPIQVDLQKGRTHFADCTIDCPVTWKSLSLPTLTAGGSVTLKDAAEEIVIPGGTELSTPMGYFTLSEPLHLESGFWITDEVALVLNVVPENGNPTGALAINNNELKMAFDLKPTGATAIRAYILLDGESEWTELLGLLLLDAVNAQPTTANSGYTDILTSSQEPYSSYLAAEFAGEQPKPFFVGLKIEGGVYNGCQLILACPGTYNIPPDLSVGGSGGNEGNAGNGNRNDGTEEGQQPNLPDTQPDKASAVGQQTELPAAPTDRSGNQNGPSNGNPQTGSSKMPTDSGPQSQAQADPSEAESVSVTAVKPQPCPSGISADAKPQTSSTELSADSGVRPQAELSGISADTKPQASPSEMPEDSGVRPQAEPSEIPAGIVLLLAAALIAGIYIARTAKRILADRKVAGL